jgi:type I restriction enzyme, S subunit
VTFAPAVSLSELIDAQPGFACGHDAPDGVFQFRMNNVRSDGSLDFSKKRRVPKGTPKLDRFLLRPGDVLFNATNSPELVGKTGFFPGHIEPAVFSNHFLRLRPRVAQLEGRFLARWLNQQFDWRVFQGMCRQWVNQATVNRDSLLGLRIPLPSLPEQRRIAEVLDRADALRAKRRAALALLDTLTQAIFLDMFGDPVANSRAWPRKRIVEIATVVTGNTPSRAVPEYFGDAIEWIKSDNINTPHYYLTRADEGLSESGKAVARTAPPMAILVTCIAGTPECIGNAAMTDREVAFNQQINAVIAHASNPHFLYAQLLVGKRLIQRASTSSMKGMVSKSRFEQVELIAPPLPTQNEFEKRIVAVQGIQAAQLVSLASLDALFASLQHRAFRGEL